MVHGPDIQYRIYDDELDLSFEDLAELPIDSLKRFPNVVIVDLSNNALQYLPEEFPRYLQNVQHLDMSNNCISILPGNFGMLSRLKYLDISCNEIRHLDVSFAKLINLEWLNLIGNPLVPILKEVSENLWCLDEHYCCAKSIVTFMQQVDKFGDSPVNGGVYDFLEQSSNDVDTKVEVLFSRKNPNHKSHLTVKSCGSNGIKDGILVEDHSGQFFYVTFGKTMKNLRPQVKSLESIPSDVKMSHLVPIFDKLNNGHNTSIGRMIRRFVFVILIFLPFLVIFLSMTVYPKDLRIYVRRTLNCGEKYTTTIFRYHSYVHNILKNFSIFPIAPPPYVQGFLEWLTDSISSVFYSLIWNYEADC